MPVRFDTNADTNPDDIQRHSADRHIAQRSRKSLT